MLYIASDVLVLVDVNIRYMDLPYGFGSDQRISREGSINLFGPSPPSQEPCHLCHCTSIVVDSSVAQGVAPQPLDPPYSRPSHPGDLGPPIWSQSNIIINKGKPLCVNLFDEILPCTSSPSN